MSYLKRRQRKMDVAFGTSVSGWVFVAVDTTISET
jgi:hypothetical protein